MIGVSTGLVATLGILKPSPELFCQMAGAMGVGELVVLGGFFIKKKRGSAWLVKYKIMCQACKHLDHSFR